MGGRFGCSRQNLQGQTKADEKERNIWQQTVSKSLVRQTSAAAIVEAIRINDPGVDNHRALEKIQDHIFSSTKALMVLGRRILKDRKRLVQRYNRRRNRVTGTTSHIGGESGQRHLQIS